MLATLTQSVEANLAARMLIRLVCVVSRLSNVPRSFSPVNRSTATETPPFIISITSSIGAMIAMAEDPVPTLAAFCIRIGRSAPKSIPCCCSVCSATA